ncbi:uncharacterized protein A1O9_00543 [Exophiala aquamarina CBS 119918]|uniref:Uncharacterized protein n=1 Tax=Exophiala aquamarina CBS 119918 TaxID=1182545 RepID=A0A072Q3T4_9EURO|nr:uncharacterized protein A1O9_00543 [Exophiala aquamarina CBS 119918]KEF62570.1 hypothetical protein A1O9_00543 [Exophiala aquamarina CBS 119918]
MAPKKESLLDLCTRATNLGNSVSVRLLEYLSTVKHHPHGFRELATDFLDISRILWAIEAGLIESSRSHNTLPADMVKELDKKFRGTHDDFMVLNQLLVKFLEYEKKKGFGKLSKGWHMMFVDTDIHKMRESLEKSRDALRMSALVFRWSLGDERVDSSVGIGYTGLAAALERMNSNRPSVVFPPPSEREQPAPSTTSHVSDIPDRLPPLPTLPPTEKISTYSLFPKTEFGREEAAHEAHAISAQPDRHSVKAASSIRSSRITTHSTGRDTGRDHSSIHKNGTLTTEVGIPEDHVSVRDADSFTQIEDMIHDIELDDKHSSQGTTIRPDPSAVPRWTPKQTSGSHSSALKTSLISAVQQRKHKMIEQLLDCGVSPENTGELNLLREAVLTRDLESVRLLLLFGADPNGFDRNKLTPLYTATEMSFIDSARLLIKYGADPNLPAGPDGESPLASAITDNKAEFARLYLTYGGDAGQMMSDGNTLLIKTINKTAPKDLTELLLNYGSDPNGKSAEGVTPVFEAIQARRLDTLTLLLDHGANPNLPGPKHPLWPSTYQSKILQLMLSRGADTKKAPGCLELATSLNNVESVKILLNAGVDPNMRKDGIYTPLCSAIRDDRPELITLLLSKGADPNHMASEYPAWKCVTHNRSQYMPQLVAAGADLHKPKGIIEKAVAHNNMDALQYLLAQKVSPNDRSPEGNTPLTTAIREDRAEMLDLLLEHGADPAIRGQDWPICMAVKRPAILKKLLPSLQNPRSVKGVMEMAVVANQLESIKLLLKAGISVEDKNGGVFSPLTTAIREDRKEIVQFLLDEAGADINAPGEHLPIVKAIRRYRGGDLDIMEMLLDRGVDINKMYRGWNSVLQAVESGNARILHLLNEKGGGINLQVKDEDSGKTAEQIMAEAGWEEAYHSLLDSQQTD